MCIFDKKVNIANFDEGNIALKWHSTKNCCFQQFFSIAFFGNQLDLDSIGLIDEVTVHGWEKQNEAEGKRSYLFFFTQNNTRKW